MLLAADGRPTWVVQPLPVNSWRLDEDQRLQSLLEDHYREVGDVCGIRVWLRADVRRDGWPPVDCHRPFRLTRSG